MKRFEMKDLYNAFVKSTPEAQGLIYNMMDYERQHEWLNNTEDLIKMAKDSEEQLKYFNITFNSSNNELLVPDDFDVDEGLIVLAAYIDLADLGMYHLEEDYEFMEPKINDYFNKFYNMAHEDKDLDRIGSNLYTIFSLMKIGA
jgi:hypothetical protein